MSVSCLGQPTSCHYDVPEKSNACHTEHQPPKVGGHSMLGNAHAAYPSTCFYPLFPVEGSLSQDCTPEAHAWWPSQEEQHQASCSGAAAAASVTMSAHSMITACSSVGEHSAGKGACQARCQQPSLLQDSNSSDETALSALFALASAAAACPGIPGRMPSVDTSCQATRASSNVLSSAHEDMSPAAELQRTEAATRSNNQPTNQQLCSSRAAATPGCKSANSSQLRQAVIMMKRMKAKTLVLKAVLELMCAKDMTMEQALDFIKKHSFVLVQGLKAQQQQGRPPSQAP